MHSGGHSLWSSTGAADSQEIKLCPIHRTCRRGDFLSDGWEPIELRHYTLFC